ncbi:MAG: tetratricopeptide repeat protein [bacterium]
MAKRRRKVENEAAEQERAESRPRESSETLRQWADFFWRHDWLILFVLAVVLKFGTWWATRATDPYFDQVVDGFDQAAYHKWAITIVEGDWVGRSNKIFYNTPLYAYFVAIFYWIGGVQFELTHFVQAWIGVGSVLLLYAVGRRFFARSVALWGTLLFLFCRPVAFYEQQLLVEGPLILLHLGFLYCVARGMETPRRLVWWILAGIMFMLCAIGRGNILLFFPVVAVWILWYFKSESWPRRAGFAVAFVVSFFVAVSPVTLHNRLIGGKWVLTTNNGPILLFIGNTYDGQGMFGYPPSFREVEKKYKGLGKPPDWGGEAIANIKSHFGTWLGIMATKTYWFWNRYNVPSNAYLYKASEVTPFLRIFPVGYGLLFPFGLAGMIASWREWRKYSILYLYILAFALSIIVIFVLGRYRLQALPVMALFTAYLLKQVAELWRGARRGEAIALGVSAIALAGALYQPPEIFTGESHELISPREDNFYATGFFQRGEYDKALQQYRRAIEREPRYGPAYKGSAGAYLRQNRTQEAALVLREGLRANPSDVDIARSLVDVDLAMGELEEARNLLEQLVRIYPQDQNLRGALQRVESAMGRQR